jgi:hypothetical protein
MRQYPVSTINDRTRKVLTIVPLEKLWFIATRIVAYLLPGSGGSIQNHFVNFSQTCIQRTHSLGPLKKPGKLINSQPGLPGPPGWKRSIATWNDCLSPGFACSSILSNASCILAYTSACLPSGANMSKLFHAKPTMPIVCKPEPVSLQRKKGF